MTIEARTQVSPTELEEITALASLVRQQDKVALKLVLDLVKNRSGDVVNDFLFYQDGQLIGYLGMYGFNKKEIEISGMVHPAHRRQGVFTRLYEAAKDECAARGYQNMLFIVEEDALPAEAFARKIGAAYAFSEYGMDLKGAGSAPQGGDVELVRAQTKEDAAVIAHLMAVGFGLSEADMRDNIANDLNNPNRQVYLGVVEGRQIAAISISLSEADTAFYYGFVVEPEQRGKGYGRYILWTLVNRLQAAGRSRHALEVATENRKALGLYQSIGFELTTAFGYYRLPL
ncbi:hypothetical protein CIG75_17260 [Tumebacillus algifaecis]|uniref:N-acetyltransferase domain-containing protein n=1 Tax=Tumebacillus algifaecis TaxID=1214604 RepID=A0A223D4S5_9BACL|nr:GNAT family N-acetyltransferase [Tumebacillus algifaecis]ASS76535.1 hypothetical protein CIG75_17260 [Tumebacillus algifaecis]